MLVLLFPLAMHFSTRLNLLLLSKAVNLPFNRLCLNKLARYCTLSPNAFLHNYQLSVFTITMGVDMVYILRVTNGSALKPLNHYTCLDSFVIGLSLIEHSISHINVCRFWSVNTVSSLKVLYNKPLSKPTMMWTSRRIKLPINIPS